LAFFLNLSFFCFFDKTASPSLEKIIKCSVILELLYIFYNRPIDHKKIIKGFSVKLKWRRGDVILYDIAEAC